MKHDKRSAHFGRDRTGTRWCASDFLARVTGRAYQGQSVCARCGCDESGFHWPNWTCAECDADMAKETHLRKAHPNG